MIGRWMKTIMFQKQQKGYIIYLAFDMDGKFHSTKVSAYLLVNVRKWLGYLEFSSFF